MDISKEELKLIIIDAITTAFCDMKLVRKGGTHHFEKTYATKTRVRNNPTHQEFIHTTRFSKLFRHALRPILEPVRSKQLNMAFFSKVNSIIKTDQINQKGFRTPVHGNLHELRNYDFNTKASFKSIFYAFPKVTFYREEGKVQLQIPAFELYNTIKPYKGATHFRMVSSAIEMDFFNQQSSSSHLEGDYIDLQEKMAPDISQIHQLPENSKHPQFLILACQFFQLVNGIYYQLLNQANNAVEITAVDVVENLEI